MNDAQQEEMCPRFPEPVPLQHPIPILKEALEKVGGCTAVDTVMVSSENVVAHFSSRHLSALKKVALKTFIADLKKYVTEFQ